MAAHDLVETAVVAARAGAAALERTFRTADLEVHTKAANDFVTRADRESEAAVLGVIRDRHPRHQILAEESGFSTGSDDHRWLVDPLDGTTNFLQGLPVFAVSVACCRGDEVVAAAVLDPQGGNLFAAGKGAGARWNGRPMSVSARMSLAGAFLATGYPFRQHRALDLYLGLFREIFQQARAIRRCGAAALDLAYTAAGVYDGFFEFRLSPWDFAAGTLLIEEAGGRISDLDGGRSFFARGNIIAGTAGVHGALLQVVQGHADEALLDRLTAPDALSE